MVRGTGRRNQDPGAFGTVSQLPSGRWRAMYYGPDGSKGRQTTPGLVPTFLSGPRVVTLRRRTCLAIKPGDPQWVAQGAA